MQLFNGPQFINWNYTYVCNLKCKHCYSRATRYPRELSTDRYLEIAEDIISAGVFTVAFGGGEPLYRKDIYRIGRVLSKGGVALYLTTNGWYLDQERAQELSDAGFRRVLVSIDSANERLNDDIRGAESFDKAKDAVGLCQRAGILRTGISCVLSKETIGDARRMVELAAEIGADEVEFKKFRPSGLGLVNRLRFELPDDVAVDINELKSEGKNLGVAVSVIGFSAFDEAKICACGWRSLCLRPNGDLTHCSYTDMVCGSLAEARLEDVWRNSELLAKVRQNGGCEAMNGAVAPSNPALKERMGGSERSQATVNEPLLAGPVVPS
ncbi:MAG: radical SAM protein [Alphaproteobacteria bacterium GM202ARS2]|nr:radical SAM protein [Alphaproteobacteria bacterium GM202ARS2]